MAQALLFGSTEVSPAERVLLVDGAPVAIGARVFDVLMALLERRDRVVIGAQQTFPFQPSLARRKQVAQRRGPDSACCGPAQFGQTHGLSSILATPTPQAQPCRCSLRLE